MWLYKHFFLTKLSSPEFTCERMLQFACWWESNHCDIFGILNYLFGRIRQGLQKKWDLLVQIDQIIARNKVAALEPSTSFENIQNWHIKYIDNQIINELR